MANRRMIHRSISTSKQVNRMSEFAQLLFTWAIPHADDYGCLDGDPEVVLATVIPMKRDRTVEQVEAAIVEWVASGLVWWYEIDGHSIIQFQTWEDHQTGLNKRTKPKHPLYPEVKDSENFREILRNSSLTELNRTELNGTEQNDDSMVQSAYKEVATSQEQNDSSSLNPEIAQLGKVHEELFGAITSATGEQILDWHRTYGFEWVMAAYKEASLQKADAPSYIRKVLRNWQKEGRITAGEGSTKVTIAAVRTSHRVKPETQVENANERYDNFFKKYPGVDSDGPRNDTG